MKEQELIAVRSKCTLETILTDKRSDHWGYIFGKVKDIAKNYGVKTVEEGEFVIFKAPKSRLQIFCGILHFSGLNYEVINEKT